MPSRSSNLHRFVFPCVAALVLSVAPGALAETPISFPVGHHFFRFQLTDAASPDHVTSSGWDPAFSPADQRDKDALVAEIASQGYTTYSVGLPGTDEPQDIPNRWTLGSSVSASELAANGFPTVSLTGVEGPVYLIDRYTNCSADTTDGCPNLSITGVGTKVVFSRSAFGLVQVTQDSGIEVWVIDSLLDALDGQVGAFKCQNCDSGHVMYSEIVGGNDAAKIYSNVTFYRSHLHGADQDPGGHADGIQCSGPCQNIFVIENNLDFLFRYPNAGLWFESSFGDAGPTYTYGNLLAGGQNPTRIVRKVSCCPGSPWVGNAVYKDNVYLGKGSNVSWTTTEFTNAGSTPITVHAAGNRRVDGTPVSFGDGSPTASEDSAVALKMAQMDQWVAEIRAVTGANPAGPSQIARPAAPLLLD